MSRVRIVVDNSVFVRAGRHKNPLKMANGCRRFLDTFHACKVIAFVSTRDMREEFKTDRPAYARTWLVNIARAGRLERIRDDIRLPAVRKRIEKLPESENMLKDVHLIEAALHTDNRIASCDEKSRKLYALYGKKLSGKIDAIVWVNPDEPSENAPDWLTSGAPADSSRQLGNYTG